MSTHVNAANRSVLVLLGLLLLTAGVLGLVLSFGGFGTGPAAGPVLPEQPRSFARENPWFWWAVAAGSLVLALLGLRWLVAQLGTDRVGRLDLTADESDGVTTVHSGAVTDAVENEVQAIRGVGGTSAHIRGGQRRCLSMTVDLTERADIAEVRARIEQGVVPHLRQALGDPDFLVDVELRPDRAGSARRDLA